jgi:penicillin-binding protein 2
MKEVVASPRGTARRYGRQHTYTIAAKTGTAQVVSRRNPNEEDNQAKMPERFRDHHLFIAFAPVDKPKIAIAIITENSNTAIEAAKIVFDYYLSPSMRQYANRSAQNKTEKTSA